VHEALDRLRPDDREMLTLNAWDDLDTADIALALGIPAATAAVRLHRARRRLARELERLGVKKADDLKSEGDFRTTGEVKGHSGEVTRE
jgi:RNA polymerase sigma-70 factor (ECF subfamily)